MSEYASFGIHHQGYLFNTEKPDMIPDMEAAVQIYKRLGVMDLEYLTGDEVLQRRME